MKDFCEFKKFINGKNVAVVGIGVSNIPLINFLVKLGANVTGFDMKSEEDLSVIEGIWRSIETGTEMTIYQSYDWNRLLIKEELSKPLVRVGDTYHDLARERSITIDRIAD